MNLQCQRPKYVSGIFCALFGTNNGIPLREIQSTQNFQFLQLSNLLQTNVVGFSASPFVCKSLFVHIKKAKSPLHNSPRVFSEFVCVCVCVRSPLRAPNFFIQVALLKAL